MKKYYLLPTFAFGGAFLAFYAVFEQFELVGPYCLIDIYERKLQVPLFSGFLTISGFVLTLTIFIVVKMHEAVYQDPDYRERVALIKDIHADYDGTKPLENLTNFLLMAVVTALFTAFSQFTLGNWLNFYSIAFCLSLAISAFVCVFLSCSMIRTNVRFWIDYIAAKPPEKQ